MVDINTQAIQEALDAGFSEADILGEMQKQGIAEQDASAAIQGLATPQINTDFDEPAFNTQDEAFIGLQKELPNLEGVRNDVYLDHLGNPTVGIGHLVTPDDGLRVGDTISDEQVRQLYEKDTQLAFTSASNQAKEAGITDQEFIKALGKVNFQLGSAWNKEFSNTWQHIKDGNYLQAAENVENSLWAKQTPVRAQEFVSALQQLDDGEVQPGMREFGLKEAENPNSEVVASMSPEQVDIAVGQMTINEPTGSALADAQFLASRLENITSKYNTVTAIRGIAGSETARQELTNDAAWVNQFIFNGMQEAGFEMFKVVGVGPNQVLIGPDDIRYNSVIQNMELAFRDKDGEIKLLTPSLIQSLNASRFEMAGAITGATAGGAAASQVPIPPVTIPTAIAKLLVVGGGALAGGAVGAFTGRGLDILYNASLLKQDLDTVRVFDQMVDAAYTDAIFTVGGGAAIKGLASGGKFVYNQAGKVIGVGDKRAMAALQRLLNINDEQADELVRRWADLNKREVSDLNTGEKLAIVASTSGRGDTVVASAATKSAEVANRVVSSIDDRTKKILKLSNSFVDPQRTRNVVEDLKDVMNASETLHSNMKLEGAKLIPSKKVFTTDLATASQEGVTAIGKTPPKRTVADREVFNFDKTIINPVEKRLDLAGIKNPQQAKQVVNFLENLKMSSKNRDFKALLETRTQIEDFLRAKPNLDKPIADSLNRALGSIDGLVKREAMQVEGGKQWLGAYRSSLAKRKEIYELKNSTLFKALNREGVLPESQLKLLAKHLRAEDGSYEQVASKLNKRTRDKIENAIVDDLINRFTIGETAGVQGIKFAELAEELGKYPFRSTDAKDMKRLINEMAAVYENDHVLAGITGRVAGGIGTSGISDDVLMRAKVQFTTAMFERFTKLAPGKKRDELILRDKLSKILENPLDKNEIESLFRGIQKASKDTKEMNEFIRDTVGDSLHNMQVEMVQRGVTGKPDIPRTLAWTAARAGKENVIKDGKYGFGVYYKLDRKNAAAQATNELQKVVSREVPNYRIANEETITEILKPVIGDRIPLPKDVKLNQAYVQKELKKRGYLGFVFNEDMLLFN